MRNLNQMEAKKPTFEDAFEQLQTLVKQMEAGDLSLEDSLKKFEEGVKLSRHCQEYLTAAEQRVQVLTQSNGSDGPPETKPFNP